MACLPIEKKMPVVHSSASVFSTDGVLHRPRAVVERQHDFLVAQEVEVLEMLEAESRTACGVDLDGAADAERVRIVAGGSCGLRGAGAGAGAAAGAACAAGAAAPLAAAGAAPLAGGVCDHAALEASNETAPAKINPAAIRILFSLNIDPAPGFRLSPSSGTLPPHDTIP